MKQAKPLVLTDGRCCKLSCRALRQDSNGTFDLFPGPNNPALPNRAQSRLYSWLHLSKLDASLIEDIAMPTLHATLSHLPNPAARPADVYPEALRDIASLEKAARAFADISHWPGYQPSPLQRLDQLAAQIGVAAIYYKDESQRFGLKSFKALGGAYRSV